MADDRDAVADRRRASCHRWVNAIEEGRVRPPRFTRKLRMERKRLQAEARGLDVLRMSKRRAVAAVVTNSDRAKTDRELAKILKLARKAPEEQRAMLPVKLPHPFLAHRSQSLAGVRDETNMGLSCIGE